MWVITEEEEKWERSAWLSMVQRRTRWEREAKPKVRQTEAQVGRRRVGNFWVSSLLPCGVLLGKGPCGPPKARSTSLVQEVQERSSVLGEQGSQAG